jgi:predicted MFS family arabinose efflux permease
MSSRIEESDSTEEAAQAEIHYPHESESASRKKRRVVSTKTVAVIVVARVLKSAGHFVWFEYLRPWSLRDVI